MSLLELEAKISLARENLKALKAAYNNLPEVKQQKANKFAGFLTDVCNASPEFNAWLTDSKQQITNIQLSKSWFIGRYDKHVETVQMTYETSDSHVKLFMEDDENPQIILHKDGISTTHDVDDDLTDEQNPIRNLEASNTPRETYFARFAYMV